MNLGLDDGTDALFVGTKRAADHVSTVAISWLSRIGFRITKHANSTTDDVISEEILRQPGRASCRGVTDVWVNGNTTSVARERRVGNGVQHKAALAIRSCGNNFI